MVILEKQIMPLGATHLYLTYVNVLYLHSPGLTTVDFRSRRMGAWGAKGQKKKDPASSFFLTSNPSLYLPFRKESWAQNLHRMPPFGPAFFSPFGGAEVRGHLEVLSPKSHSPFRVLISHLINQV